jgi:tetratricopeptide (TPR) repeat protein
MAAYRLVATMCLLWLFGMGWSAEPTAAPEILPVPTFFEQALALNHILEPELNDSEVISAFNQLVASCGIATSAAVTQEDRVAALNRVLLDDRHVVYRSNEFWRDSTMSGALLRQRCNCIGGSTLYVAVASALGLPIHMVLLPDHAFVRWDDGTTRINIETTSHGRRLSDWYYLYSWFHCDPADVVQMGWGKSLDADQSLAELFEQAAWMRASQGNLAQAAAMLERAIHLAPRRLDLAVQRLVILSGLDGRRQEARDGLRGLLSQHPPASVAVSALLCQAHEQSLRRHYSTERELILTAYTMAPKTKQAEVLRSLAMCDRSLGEKQAAVQAARMVVALTHPASTTMASALYLLAIAQREDGDMAGAMASIKAGIVVNPEGWYLDALEAGYLVVSGSRNAGISRFKAITPPRDDAQMYACMRIWFACVCHDDAAFLGGLDQVLQSDGSGYALEWIDQDPDLRRFSGQPAFDDRIEKHRCAILEDAAVHQHDATSP